MKQTYGIGKKKAKEQTASHSEYQNKMLYIKKSTSYCADMLMFFPSVSPPPYFSSYSHEITGT